MLKPPVIETRTMVEWHNLTSREVSFIIPDFEPDSTREYYSRAMVWYNVERLPNGRFNVTQHRGQE